ncbi:hypothetical protein K523DRAFT_420337 [Schizophyllum commune Tattone D]|nr:hypothetical protein K523DRAFT_420337 [Schizophyllum commune Tattone D]
MARGKSHELIDVTQPGCSPLAGLPFLYTCSPTFNVHLIQPSAGRHVWRLLLLSSSFASSRTTRLVLPLEFNGSSKNTLWLYLSASIV